MRLCIISHGQIMDHWDATIIGPGEAGLSDAIALANAGKRVLVLEQHSLQGGWPPLTNDHYLDAHRGNH